MLTFQVARAAAGQARPGGTPLFMTGARQPGVVLPAAAIAAAALPALGANLALELAPVRGNPPPRSHHV
jgi:hypothetical protein